LVVNNKSYEKEKIPRHVEKICTKTEFIKKLRGFADALETKSKFSVQIAGEKISVPKKLLSILNTNQIKNKKKLNFK
jgi:hypothetical protein